MRLVEPRGEVLLSGGPLQVVQARPATVGAAAQADRHAGLRARRNSVRTAGRGAVRPVEGGPDRVQPARERRLPLAEPAQVRVERERLAPQHAPAELEQLDGGRRRPDGDRGSGGQSRGAGTAGQVRLPGRRSRPGQGAPAARARPRHSPGPRPRPARPPSKTAPKRGGRVVSWAGMKASARETDWLLSAAVGT